LLHEVIELKGGGVYNMKIALASLMQTTNICNLIPINLGPTL